jgi:hypothetical protein
MNDVIAPKRPSLRLGLVEAMMFLKLIMSLILNNSTDVADSPIWNMFVLFHLELLDDIDDFDVNETEEDDDL